MSSGDIIFLALALGVLAYTALAYCYWVIVEQPHGDEHLEGQRKREHLALIARLQVAQDRSRRDQK